MMFEAKKHLSKVLRLNIFLALLYFVSGKLSFLIAVSFKSVTSAIFFPEGFALIFLLLYGKQILPGVFLGQLTLGLVNDLNLSTSLGFSAGNCLELFVASLILNKYGFEKEKLNLKNYFFIVFLIAFVLQPISAGCGSITMWLFENQKVEMLMGTFKYWWFGNFMGQILAVSAFWSISTISKNEDYRKAIWSPLFATCLFGGSFFIIFLIWGDHEAFQSMNSFFIVSPFIVIMALIYDFTGAAFSSLIIALISQILTAQGLGPFSLESTQEGLIYLNKFIISITLSSGLIGVMSYERRKNEQALKENQAHLEKLVEQLKQNTIELKRSNTDLREFASIASHDLQEPLRKVIMFGERMDLKFSKILGTEGVGYLDRIQKSTLRMQSFISDLLELSKINSKPKNFKLIELEKVVSEVLSDLELRIKEKQASIEVNSLPTLKGDKVQMRQLFQNLISNALKFQKKDIPPVIRISSQRDPSGYWKISIQDNGIGMNPKFIDRIFKPFERLNGRSAFEGSGIGLSICQKIMSRHNGTINVEGNLDQGSCFIFTLPDSN